MMVSGNRISEGKRNANDVSLSPAPEASELSIEASFFRRNSVDFKIAQQVQWKR